MELYHVKATKETPEIMFNPETNVFQIKGISYHPNTRNVYEPVMKWLSDYFNELKENKKENEPITFHFTLKYLNSSSFKYLLEIMRTLTVFNENGIPVEIIWNYEDVDEDIKDLGISLFESTSIKLPFKYVPFKE